jgi:hypothetical protein
VPLPDNACPDSFNILPALLSETNDLGAKHPEKLQEMIKRLDALLAADRTRP